MSRVLMFWIRPPREVVPYLGQCSLPWNCHSCVCFSRLIVNICDVEVELCEWVLLCLVCVLVSRGPEEAARPSWGTPPVPLCDLANCPGCLILAATFCCCNRAEVWGLEVQQRTVNLGKFPVEPGPWKLTGWYLAYDCWKPERTSPRQPYKSIILC